MNDYDVQIEETVFKGKVFDVVECSYQVTADDTMAIISRQLVTKNPVVVCMVIKRSTNSVILTEEFRVGSGRAEKGLVAGIVDAGEVPIQAAVREMIEETGYTPSSVSYIGQSYSSSGFTDELVHHFICYIDESIERKKLKLDSDEFVRNLEVNTEDYFDMLRTGEISSSHAHTNALKAILGKYIKKGSANER